ncbi:flagellar associated protein [Phytophthora cinnamomi]|uniref:flagellar associated protein n=1 Tax=Phytophthora cinnamomi TaxID=4785 RepID=UPI00355AA035|nr:flagellar associated protein [Phytophthora cinnamomi]
MQRGRTISEHPTAESNPFTLPSDEEVFRMRETEKQRKEEEKNRNSKLKIYDKTTASSKIGNIRRFRSDDTPTGLDNYSVSQSRQTRGLVAAATATISNDRLREKENMADFIAKKREMFLVQMSLDTKREEIRKLEEKAQLKEEALKKSELMLEEDAVRFDTFLKENDKKAHEAIKRAEKETKAKADKVQEIKKLNQQIQLVQSDMSKLSEQLQDCLQYKAFLDELTPQEYEIEQRDKKRARQMARLQKRKDKILREWELQKAKALAEIEERERAEKERPDSKNGKKKVDKNVKVKEIIVPPMPNLDSMPVTSSGEEIPMYFQNPQQLLDIFTALEESNLFLIQNSQETEQTLEELKQNYRETKRLWTAKLKRLR